MSSPKACANSTVRSVEPSLTTAISTSVTGEAAMIGSRAARERAMMRWMLASSYKAGMAMSNFTSVSPLDPFIDGGTAAARRVHQPPTLGRLPDQRDAHLNEDRNLHIVDRQVLHGDGIEQCLRPLQVHFERWHDRLEAGPQISPLRHDRHGEDVIRLGRVLQPVQSFVQCALRRFVEKQTVDHRRSMPVFV